MKLYLSADFLKLIYDVFGIPLEWSTFWLGGTPCIIWYFSWMKIFSIDLQFYKKSEFLNVWCSVDNFGGRYEKSLKAFFYSSQNCSVTFIQLLFNSWTDANLHTFFREQTTENNYVFLTKLKNERKNLCTSNVGKIGGKQEIILNKRCYDYGSILHEIFHSFGFPHENQRSDFMDYIKSQ